MTAPALTPRPAGALEAHGVHFAYNGRVVLRGVDLAVAPGDMVSLLGANGSGKTTLLLLLLGLLRPDAGEVVLNGRPLRCYPRRELARQLAYVPQTHTVPFPYTVRDVVLLGRLPHTGLVHSPSPQDQAVVAKTLARLGIESLADRPYSEVSGGERQLTLIARALAQGARILVLDEPATGLDYGNQLRFLQHLRGLAAEGFAIVKATHHPEHALLASTRVALLHAGTILRQGPPREVVTPAAIQQLYRIQVNAFHAPAGQATAFYPVSPLDSNP